MARPERLAELHQGYRPGHPLLLPPGALYTGAAFAGGLRDFAGQLVAARWLLGEVGVCRVKSDCHPIEGRELETDRTCMYLEVLSLYMGSIFRGPLAATGRQSDLTPGRRDRLLELLGLRRAAHGVGQAPAGRRPAPWPG
jgi:hypothetical protein